MTGGRCHQPKLSGRGSPEENPSPLPSPPTAAAAAVYLYSQVCKSPTGGSPFEEDPSKSAILPASIAVFLFHNSAGRRKHKKAQPDAANNTVPVLVAFSDKVKDYILSSLHMLLIQGGGEGISRCKANG